MSRSFFWVTVTLTSDLISRIIVYEAYLLHYLRLWMHFRMSKCRVPFWGHCDLDLWPRYKSNCFLGISPILFEAGIINLVCGCILGWWSVAYRLHVTMTFTSFLELSCPKHISYNEIGIPNLVCGCILRWQSTMYHFRALWPWPPTWLKPTFSEYGHVAYQIKGNEIYDNIYNHKFRPYTPLTPGFKKSKQSSFWKLSWCISV